MRIIFYICFYLWFIFGLFGLATNLSVSIPHQTAQAAYFRNIINLIFVFYLISALLFLFSALRYKKSKLSRKFEKILTNLLILNNYELPLAEFLIMNKDKSAEADIFLTKRISKFPENPESGGKLIIDSGGIIRYFYFDKEGKKMLSGRKKDTEGSKAFYKIKGGNRKK